MNLRFYVDYNDVDSSGNQVPISDGNIYLKEINGENMKHLQPGLRITVYDGDGLEFDAVAGFDEQYQYWYGEIDSSTRRDTPSG